MSLIRRSTENGWFPAFPGWMDDFFSDNDLKGMKSMTVPAVNVSETKEAFKLSLAAPGYRKEDFKVEVKEGVLTISAETRQEHEDKGEKYTRKEYTCSSFSRSFTLPEGVLGGDIVASYQDGELKVTLPKKVKEEKPAMQIAVK
jgi:HSP20 family protein